MRTVLETPNAPGALGPYSVAVEAGGLVFISGQIAINPDGENLSGQPVGPQTTQIMENLGRILSDIGLGYEDVVKTTIFLRDMADFPTVNEIYGSFFTTAPPARSTIEVSALPGGFAVEIEVVAAR